MTTDLPYHHLITPAEIALESIRSGDHVYIPLQVSGRVAAIAEQLRRRLLELESVEVTNLPGLDGTWFDDEVAQRLQVNVPFVSPASRELVSSGRADYLPWWSNDSHKSRLENRPGARALDVVIVGVRPPNAAGYCCFGNALGDAKAALRIARTKIAVLDSRVPITFGDTWIHYSEFDCLVECPSAPAPPQPAQPEPAPWDEPVTRYVASLVRDRDTVQVGVGSTTSALVRLGALSDKHDLAYFGGLTVPGLVSLVRDGTITGKYSSLHPGKFITTSAGNSPEDIEYIHLNPAFEFYGAEYVHNPMVIARNKNMVGINNAIAVDLTGQVASSHIAEKIWSGTGGQLASVIGAFCSDGGRSVIVVPSTANSGTVSRIVPTMAPGQAVTIPAEMADIVVTEFGVARLLNKTLRQRAEELIAVAHPDFRAELRRSAFAQQ